MSDLNRKNTAAVEITLKALTERVYQQDVVIAELRAAMSGLQNRVNAQEHVIAILRVKLTGTGPSV